MPLLALFAALAAIAPQRLDPAPSPGAPLDRPCRLFGELVDAAGAPVAGAVLRIHGGPGWSVLGPSPGAPRGWQHVTSDTTGDDGKFSLTFVPPRTFEYILTANAPGHGSVGWEWSGLAPGEELDLGTRVLEPKAVLVGHILDAEGNLLVLGWTVSAAFFERTGGVPGRSLTGNSFIDPATGQFRMEGLPPGTWTVSANNGSQRIDAVTVTTRVGEDTCVELRHGEPSPRRALVVTIGTRPFHTFQPDPGTVHAIARDGAHHLLTQARRRADEWRHVDVAPGTYRVEVRDPRFADWTHTAVRTGEAVRANLVGSATLHLEVVDGETGAPIDGWFYFSGLGPGRHALLALSGPWNDVWKSVELPCAEPVVLTMPDAVPVTVQLTLPEGEPRDALHLRPGRASGELRDLVRSSRTLNGEEDLWAAGADGVYAARHMPLGTHTLEVVRETANGSARGFEAILRCDVTVVGPGPLELRVPPE